MCGVWSISNCKTTRNAQLCSSLDILWSSPPKAAGISQDVWRKGSPACKMSQERGSFWYIVRQREPTTLWGAWTRSSGGACSWARRQLLGMPQSRPPIWFQHERRGQHDSVRILGELVRMHAHEQRWKGSQTLLTLRSYGVGAAVVACFRGRSKTGRSRFWGLRAGRDQVSMAAQGSIQHLESSDNPVKGCSSTWPVSKKAMVRSQDGPGAGVAFTTCPTNFLTKFSPQVFRILILRRLGLPLPLTARNCGCGGPLDSCGHHRAACGGGGGRAKRVCSGERGTTGHNKLMVRDLELEFLQDPVGRRLKEVAVYSCSGAPNWSLTGSWWARFARMGAPRDLQLTLTESHARWRKVWEGRWLDETRSFLSQLDRVKARRETSLMKKRAGQAWRLRRNSILVCAVARAVATSILESPRARDWWDHTIGRRYGKGVPFCLTDRVSLDTGEPRWVIILYWLFLSIPNAQK